MLFRSQQRMIHDCLSSCRTHTMGAVLRVGANVKAHDSTERMRVDAAVQAARAAHVPEQGDLMRDVYVSY